MAMRLDIISLILTAALCCCGPGPGAPEVNIWTPCDSPATACLLSDGATFGQCVEVADGSVCAPYMECIEYPLGDPDPGENSGPWMYMGSCLWTCDEDRDCPVNMICGGVCVYPYPDAPDVGIPGGEL